MICELSIHEIEAVAGGPGPSCPDGYTITSLTFDSAGNLTGWVCTSNAEIARDNTGTLSNAAAAAAAIIGVLVAIIVMLSM